MRKSTDFVLVVKRKHVATIACLSVVLVVAVSFLAIRSYAERPVRWHRVTIYANGSPSKSWVAVEFPTVTPDGRYSFRDMHGDDVVVSGSVSVEPIPPPTKEKP